MSLSARLRCFSVFVRFSILAICRTMSATRLRNFNCMIFSGDVLSQRAQKSVRETVTSFDLEESSELASKQLGLCHSKISFCAHPIRLEKLPLIQSNFRIDRRFVPDDQIGTTIVASQGILHDLISTSCSNCPMLRPQGHASNVFLRRGAAVCGVRRADFNCPWVSELVPTRCNQ